MTPRRRLAATIAAGILAAVAFVATAGSSGAQPAGCGGHGAPTPNPGYGLVVGPYWIETRRLERL